MEVTSVVIQSMTFVVILFTAIFALIDLITKNK